MKNENKIPSKINDVENRYPAFSIILNLLYSNKPNKGSKSKASKIINDKPKLKISEIVKNAFNTDKVIKTEEQTVRNIIKSISEFGVNYDKRTYKILEKNEKIANTQVNKNELINYLFSLVGNYFIVNIDSEHSFYDEIKVNKKDILKKIISLYLDYMIYDLRDVCEMNFSDAITDMEQNIVFVSERKEIMNKINDLNVKDLIKKWANKINKTVNEIYAEKAPFVE